jgi:hypothetical protein
MPDHRRSERQYGRHELGCARPAPKPEALGHIRLLVDFDATDLAAGAKLAGGAPRTQSAAWRYAGMLGHRGCLVCAIARSMDEQSLTDVGDGVAACCFGAARDREHDDGDPEYIWPRRVDRRRS